MLLLENNWGGHVYTVHLAEAWSYMVMVKNLHTHCSVGWLYIRVLLSILTCNECLKFKNTMFRMIDLVCVIINKNDRKHNTSLK